MGWYWSDHMDGWGWAGAAVSTLVLVALVATVVLVALRGAQRTGAAPRRAPEEVLADRYARGEIDAEELRRRLDTLRDTGVGTG